MSTYGYTQSQSAPGTTFDYYSITMAANRRAQLIEVSISGQGTSSNANEFIVGVCTTWGTTQPSGGNQLTAGKLAFTAPAAGAIVTKGTWGASQPTVLGSILSIGVNSNGGVYRWVARPGEEIECNGSAASGTVNSLISIRAGTQTGNVSSHIMVVEDPQ